MFDQETWKFINSFADWLSAIGTIMAVIVALYLARNDKQIKLKVSAGHWIEPPNDNFPAPTDYLMINVVNVGYRPVTISKIGWEIGFLFKKILFQNIVSNRLSSKLPIKLAETGDEATYCIRLYIGEVWLEKFLTEHIGAFPRLKTLFLKIRVDTTVGKSFRSQINKALRREMIKKSDDVKQVKMKNKV